MSCHRPTLAKRIADFEQVRADRSGTFTTFEQEWFRKPLQAG